MAIFKPSPLVGAIAGPVGGCTFVSTGKGNVLKASASTCRAFSRLQLERQAHMAWARTQWAGLTVAQKAAWTTAAALVAVTNRLGDKRTMSGYEAFVKAHTVRIGSYATLYSVPFARLVGPMVSVSAAAFSAAGTYNLTTTGLGLSGAQATVLYGATQESSKMVTRMSNWRYLGRLTNNYNSAFNIYSLWVGQFGRGMVAGQVYGLKLVNINACHWSTEYEHYGTVTA